MKKVLVTGKNGYIGTEFTKYISQYDNQYQVDQLDVKGNNWKDYSFSDYDTVLHAAAIVHTKETKQNKELFFKVNRDLTFELAQKAKKDGVKKFIFLSTMGVYGIISGEITDKTTPNPKSSYGKSKLEAEILLNTLTDSNFSVAIIRPPMVYGENCKGNYQTLELLAKKLPVFPNYDNKRSMINVVNLSTFIKEIIDDDKSGIFMPQDAEYICTCKMVRKIAQDMGKDIKLLRILNPFVVFLKLLTQKGKKAFGDLYYKM